MSCGCASEHAITDASAPLINNFSGSQYGPALTTLLRALDKVEMKMRDEAPKVTWKPSQFPQETVPYGQKPQGTEVMVKSTPLYFEENDSYVYNLGTPGPEGGICEGASLCEEPPANKVPGDTWQSRTYRMQGTAWETPVFCLKDLLFYQNGVETLRRFLINVERTPFQFYDNYIRNLIWEVGEKYILAQTDAGMLWNSPDRVTTRTAPNMVDFRTFHPSGVNADAAVPKLAGIQYLKYILNQFLGSDMSPLNAGGDRELMMVGVEPDVFGFVYNDECAPCSYVEAGEGFNPFTFKILDKLPFAFKNDDKWIRGDFDAAGEFIRIPSHIYVEQNGGMDLRVNPAWLVAKYGVLSFMDARPLKYYRFGTLPNMPSNVPKESLKYLSPRFQWAPLTEKCSYTRGLVQWRAEDEFGFLNTANIYHVIYRRDELGSYLRQAEAGTCIEIIAPCETPIPVTCEPCQLLSCCVTAGPADISGVDYRDTTYTIEVSANCVDNLGWDVGIVPFAATLTTVKGTFNGYVISVSSDNTLVVFGVDPGEHIGGHFCCEDQLIGFDIALATNCQALLDGGLAVDPFDHTLYHGQLSQPLDAIATDTVTVFFDTSCGTGLLAEFVVSSITDKRIVLTATPADWPDGVPCEDAVKVCANNTVGCDGCIPVDPAPCVADSVTAIPEEEAAASVAGDGEATASEASVSSSIEAVSDDKASIVSKLLGDKKDKKDK